MEVIQKLLCEAANIMPDGRLNVLGSFVELNFFQFPVPARAAVLAMRIRVTQIDRNSTHTIVVHVVDEDGKPICPPQQTTLAVPQALPPGDLIVNALVAFPPFVIPRPGRYRVDISIDNRIEADEAFKVNSVPAPPGLQGPRPSTPPQ